MDKIKKIQMSKILAILTILSCSQLSFANNDRYEQAIKKAAEVYYENSELKTQVESNLFLLQKTYVPAIVINNGTPIFFIMNGVVGQKWQIYYKCEF